MRDDQRERIKELSVSLADVFIDEADPREWSGDGQSLSEMDSGTRGDRAWCKKNAIATGALLMRAIELTEKLKPNVSTNLGHGAHIEKFEAQARGMLTDAQQRHEQRASASTH